MTGLSGREAAAEEARKEGETADWGGWAAVLSGIRMAWGLVESVLHVLAQSGIQPFWLGHWQRPDCHAFTCSLTLAYIDFYINMF